MSGRGLRRFVEDLLGHRRPRPFAADPEDAGALRAAITLRAARPGAGEPSQEFVEGLHQRIVEARQADLAAGQISATQSRPAPAVRPGALPAPAGWDVGTDQGAAPGAPSAEDGSRPAPAAGRPGPRRRDTRRRFVQITSIAAGSAAVGIAVDRAIDAGGSGGGDGTQPTAGAGGVLIPDAGVWRTVATTHDLPEGGVRAFDTGSVSGFVRRVDGQVLATSGVCTHQGCHLTLDAPERRLTCPCHRTVFALNGEVEHSKLPTPPRTLPSLTIRELDGVIQVYVPSTPA